MKHVRILSSTLSQTFNQCLEWKPEIYGDWIFLSISKGKLELPAINTFIIHAVDYVEHTYIYMEVVEGRLLESWTLYLSRIGVSVGVPSVTPYVLIDWSLFTGESKVSATPIAKELTDLIIKKQQI